MSSAAEKTNTPDTDIPTARVVAVQEGLVEIEALDRPDGSPGRLVKNEVVFILPGRLAAGGRQERLKAEILRVRGNTADAQVYESTQGVAAGDPVVQSGQLLSVALGPGLLGQVYDGLQAPLSQVANRFGIFLPRGADVAALNPTAKWTFSAQVSGHANPDIATSDRHVLSDRAGRYRLYSRSIRRGQDSAAEPDRPECTGGHRHYRCLRGARG